MFRVHIGAALGVIGAAAVCTLSFSYHARANEASARTGRVPRFEPAACSTLMPLRQRAQCGFLVVPENRNKRNGKTIRVAVAIIAAASKRPAPSPLVYLGGGPGSLPVFLAKSLVAAGFNADRDLILVDQRGTYYSRPQLTCPVIDRFNQRLLNLVYDAESTRQEHVAATRACRAQLVAKGVDLAAYNTTENAADFADLRRVLQYKQWNVYGISYGTGLALTLMRIDPRGIRSVVLDSTAPPALVNVALFWSNARDGFRNLFAACSEQQTCRGRYPKLGERFTALVRELESHPVTTKVNDPVTHRNVSVTTDGGALANWLVSMSLHSPPQYKDVPLWIDELAAGRAQQIASSRAAMVAGEGFVGYGLIYGVACAEWLPMGKDAQILAEGRRAFPGYPSSVLAEPAQLTFFSDDCRVWNVPKAPLAIRRPIRSEIPTLILSGGFDAVTGLPWAKAAAATLPNSRILVFPGIGHGVVEASKCAQTVMSSFLARPDAPDVSCVASVKPPSFVAR